MKVMKMIALIFFIFESNFIYADEIGNILKIKGSEAVVNLKTDEEIDNAKIFYILNDENKDNAELKIVKIVKKMALFKIIKGQVHIGSTVTTNSPLQKIKSLKNSYKHKWASDYQLSLGTLKSNTSMIKNSLMSHKINFNYSLLVNQDYEFLLGAGIQMSSLQTTYADKTQDSSSEIAPVLQSEIFYKLYPDWRTSLLINSNRYSVTKVSSDTSATQSFIFQNSIGLGIEWSFAEDFKLKNEETIVLPNKSNINSIKSGFKIKLNVDYQWNQFTLGLSGQYQNIKTQLDNDTGIINTLIIGYNF